MTGQNRPNDEEKGGGDGSFAAQRIIVIGASAGGFETFEKLIAGLPADFSKPIFMV